jgi:isopentenyl-diphosphate delta-isomerase
MPEDRVDAIVSFEDEPLIRVDAADVPIGYGSKAACHDGEGLLHRAFSVFVFAPDGALLLQQRSALKRLWPMWWSNSCCSHPRRGEALEAAVVRRTREELAVQLPLTHTHAFEYHARYGEAGSEHELCHVYVGCTDAPVVVNANEVAATRWMLPEALDAALADADAPYTPWLRLEWAALRTQHWAAVEAAVRAHQKG